VLVVVHSDREHHAGILDRRAQLRAFHRRRFSGGQAVELSRFEQAAKIGRDMPEIEDLIALEDAWPGATVDFECHELHGFNIAREEEDNTMRFASLRR
jgi:hypothetical protein